MWINEIARPYFTQLVTATLTRSSSEQETLVTKEAGRNSEEATNDPAPSKGTNKPWKRPGQASQNPDDPEPAKPDLEKWQDSKTK